MGMPHDIEARRFYRVAYQRLEDGSLMLEKLGRPKGAVYLAGYAVECILKALLLAATPLHDRSVVARSFRGAIAHDLRWLRNQLSARNVTMPLRVKQELTYVESWSVELRYEPGEGGYEDAQQFTSSTRVILDWADGRL